MLLAVDHGLDQPVEVPRSGEAPAAIVPSSVLTVDIGSSTISVLLAGETTPRHCDSGKKLTPQQMVAAVKTLAEGWSYDGISIGYPGHVGDTGPISEPSNMGHGWVGFDFVSAFGCPVRIVNDAALQALGSYEGGRMLLLILGRSVGAALISENVIVTLDIARLSHGPGLTVGQVLGRAGMRKSGKSTWRTNVDEVIRGLKCAFLAEDVVVSGGNTHNIKKLPSGVRRGNDLTCFRGGSRLWTVQDVRTLHAEGTKALPGPTPSTDWRLL